MLTADEERSIEALAQRLAQLGLAPAALLFLEAHRPLGFIGSQVFLFLQPLLGWGSGTPLNRYARLLEKQEAISRLIDRLEGQ
ncbi:MAG: hypothetical protein HYY04_04240 [Chloroflexi bacterium]|nr:hypothetical protein [Chloroflexota bacterium]